LFKLALIAY